MLCLLLSTISSILSSPVPPLIIIICPPPLPLAIAVRTAAAEAVSAAQVDVADFQLRLTAEVRVHCAQIDRCYMAFS